MYNPWNPYMYLKKWKKNCGGEPWPQDMYFNDYLGGHGGFEEWLKNYVGKQILAYHYM